MDINHTKNNAEMLATYNSKMEIEKITRILGTGISDKKSTLIVDVGCGNGRSIRLLRRVFKNAKIIAIDKFEENIEYAEENIKFDGVDYRCENAFQFFPSDKKFDLIFFSWSLFDMSSKFDLAEIEDDIWFLLKNVKASLRDDGMILVTQPMKGGTFEKLLSKFLPGSDENYEMIHKLLLESGFAGPKELFPSEEDELAIWSHFDFTNEDQLYRGIASVVELELATSLSREDFDKILIKYRKENCNGLNFTDCVNIYYLKGGVNK